MSTDQRPFMRWRASGFLRIHEPHVPGIYSGVYLEGREAEAVAGACLAEGQVWVVSRVHTSGREDGVRFVTLLFGDVQLTPATMDGLRVAEGGSYA